MINALAAAACTLAAGAPLAAIAQGLNDFVPVKGRSRAFSVHCAGRDITVVDDTYNANPDSMQAAIAVLAELPAPRLLVLGDMGEVGDQGPAFHADGFADGDLHLLDVARIPQRLEQRIAETQRDQVLHAFLAEVVVDAVDAFLVEGHGNAVIYGNRRSEILADRLLQHHAGAGTGDAVRGQCVAGGVVPDGSFHGSGSIAAKVAV